ncbi:DUF5926 family protein [Actinomyces minihominis]|uniref:DUF5926 family protein n=1 Tax=Actinomyces minihominis TaxID=2002838 RepID=UPI000C06ADA6|nr:DUF5926 family protein [Actinomyces minihominis]
MGKASRRKKIDPSKKGTYRAPIPFVDRPFEGLTIERELVAMRELIPCATLTAKSSKETGGVEFDFVTLVPDGAPAMIREDGRILVGLQTRFNSSDLSHDLGGALGSALVMKASGETGVVRFDVRDEAPRLQEILDSSFLAEGAQQADAAAKMEITEDFGFWFGVDEELSEDTLDALQQNREDMVPTEAVPGTEGMYWCAMNNNFVRYVTEIDEAPLFTALARLQASGTAKLGEGSKFVGAFRACGIAIPVFQVDSELTAADLEKPAHELRKSLDAALALDTPLNDDERRARAGLVSRQVTIR